MAYGSSKVRGFTSSGTALASRWVSSSFLFLLFSCFALAATNSTKQPNILIILTDDQDNFMGTVENMPLLQKYIAAEGSSHPNHYCTIALCCPSRASLWTGLQGHNHNVTDIDPPYGGYPKIVSQGINDDYLPLWMQDAGYATYYAGKLWNSHTSKNYNKPFVRGWNESEFFIGPNTYVYYNVSTTLNQGKPTFHPGDYSTDIVGNRTYQFLQSALKQDQPWFIVAAPVAPHADTSEGDGGGRGDSGPPPPAKVYADRFPGYIVPRTANFNPDKPGGAAYYKYLPQLNQTVIDYNDNFGRQRLQALLSVDDVIANLTQTLSDAGALDNTYVFFTSDNGFHLSQHRLYAGKNCGLETDINVPFLVRGPGISPGSTNNAVTNHVDMSPTILAIAGVAQHSNFDGAVMPLNDELSNNEASGSEEHVNVEHWGLATPVGLYGTYNFTNPDEIYYENNTYKSARLIGDGYSMYYSVWCNGDHEFYDMTNDPGQLDNLFIEPDVAQQFNFTGRSFNQTAARLDTLLMVLKSCKQDACRQPWSTLFPGGQVSNLVEAMDQKYDDFFANQPQVSFERCELGYILSAEGPQDPNIYSPGVRRSHIPTLDL